MLIVDRHLLISCAPRHVGSSKQLRSVKNTENQDVANAAVMAAMWKHMYTLYTFIY